MVVTANTTTRSKDEIKQPTPISNTSSDESKEGSAYQQVELETGTSPDSTTGSNHDTKKDRKKKKKKKDKKRKKEKKEKKRKKRKVDLLDAEEEKQQKQHQAQESEEGLAKSRAALHSGARPIVESSATTSSAQPTTSANQQPASVTLLLFYQYMEPTWSDAEYKHEVLPKVEALGKQAGLAGRMRVAKEGLNCTLSGTRDGIFQFCRALRQWKPHPFLQTEFKLTHNLPPAQGFGNSSLKIIPVQELVHYGLDGDKAPPLSTYRGTHLEPADYHAKLAQPDTVVIDVRNHYEAAIGRFVPPTTTTTTWVDPKMRKSTEFPVWLNESHTQEQLRNKQVLMYCTGGIRCERASALLKYKMAHDPAVQQLNIQGVYQLQGGIDKYFKEFPDGGYWQGQNYTFDRRGAHAPPALEASAREATSKEDESSATKPPAAGPAAPNKNPRILGKCEGCGKPWNKYGGKRRCPTCGVPSLTCKDCWQAHVNGTKPLGPSVRCDLCVEQGITSKHQLRQREAQALHAYETAMQEQQLLHPAAAVTPASEDTSSVSGDSKGQPAAESVEAAPNPDKVSRLLLKNMCRKSMTEEVLQEVLPGMTHLVWRLDHRRQPPLFLGQAWVEMATPEFAAQAVAKSGLLSPLGRPLYISYQPPSAKDKWPPPHSALAQY